MTHVLQKLLRVSSTNISYLLIRNCVARTAKAELLFFVFQFVFVKR